MNTALARAARLALGLVISLYLLVALLSLAGCGGGDFEGPDDAASSPPGIQPVDRKTNPEQCT
jgi:predicted small lipoprotein YifL